MPSLSQKLIIVAKKRKRKFSLIWQGTRGKKVFNFAAEFMGSSPSKFIPLTTLSNSFHCGAKTPSLGQSPDYCCCQKAKITAETLLTKINEIQILDYIVYCQDSGKKLTCITLNAFVIPLFYFESSCNKKIIFRPSSKLGGLVS
jgi:hypothetical protein